MPPIKRLTYYFLLASLILLVVGLLATITNNCGVSVGIDFALVIVVFGALGLSKDIQ